MGKHTGMTKDGYTVKWEKPGNWLVAHPDGYHTIKVWGNGHYYEPQYLDDGQDYIVYHGERVDLGELVLIQNNAPGWMRKFGQVYCNDSFFSGMILNWNDNEDAYQVFTFCC